MKILAIEKDVPGVTAEQCSPYLREEAVRTWDLYQAGVLRELYFRADRSSAVLVLECPDLKTANRVLESLPLVREGLIDFEVIPLAPYPGFARLFAGGA